MTNTHAKIDANTVAINANKVSIDAHDITINSHTTRLDNHDTTLNTHTATINAHETTINSHTTTINSLQTQINGKVSITSLQKGTTTVDGACIKTGTISADRIDVNTLFGTTIQGFNIKTLLNVSGDSVSAVQTLSTGNQLWVGSSSANTGLTHLYGDAHIHGTLYSYYLGTQFTAVDDITFRVQTTTLNSKLLRFVNGILVAAIDQ